MSHRPPRKDKKPVDKLRVLIIDDDAESIEPSVVGMRLQGALVWAAASGPEGVALARELLPDVILLDLWMPEIDGCTVVSILRSHGDTAKIPIALLTAAPEPRGDLCGADAFIPKPCAPDELFRLVNGVVQGTACDSDRRGQPPVSQAI